ncbi:hypothetical protein AGLY_015377, partial [Aphis glycines]
NSEIIYKWFHKIVQQTIMYKNDTIIYNRKFIKLFIVFIEFIVSIILTLFQINDCIKKLLMIAFKLEAVSKSLIQISSKKNKNKNKKKNITKSTNKYYTSDKKLLQYSFICKKIFYKKCVNKFYFKNCIKTFEVQNVLIIESLSQNYKINYFHKLFLLVINIIKGTQCKFIYKNNNTQQIKNSLLEFWK